VTYRFLAQARADFDDAVDWYDAQQPPLGDDFIAVHRYLYLVYYEVTVTELLILCVVHGKRRSHPWRQRLP